MAPSFIAIRNIVKRYPGPDGEVFALNDVSLEIPAPSFVSIEGPNGSGKTTLLNIVGLLDRPSDGDVIIDEINTTQLSEGARTRLRSALIGYVFQGDSIMPHMTAEQNVMLPGLIRNERRALLKEKARVWLKRLELDHRAQTKGVHLSGGEKQRVALARALFTAPRILIADEPTTFLDERTRDLFMSMLREAHDNGATVLYTTHHQKERGDTAVFLDAGAITSVGGIHGGRS